MIDVLITLGIVYLALSIVGAIYGLWSTYKILRPANEETHHD